MKYFVMPAMVTGEADTGEDALRQVLPPDCKLEILTPEDAYAAATKGGTDAERIYAAFRIGGGMVFYRRLKETDDD